jgi:HAE1 family hydrophobic/amphiphilic exporter-1
MRVWLLPEKMAAYNLVPSDVTTAINEQSREAAAGKVGSNSGSSFEYVIRYKGKYDQEQEYVILSPRQWSVFTTKRCR